MRTIVRLVACVGIALTAAGCDPTDRHYFTQGVGTNLYAEDTNLSSGYVAAQTDLQDQYVTHICRQAGLDPSNCGVDTFNSKVWGLFVQAGMNDIDQRCDGYLTWLDNLRRSKEPFAKQITDTGTAANLIMQATGASKASLAIVAAAFGLASQSFDNLTTRLLVEVPQSTVQAVVLSHQKQYREELFGSATNKTAVVIASKPAAIYALRSYLRLCMPMTIETQINSIVTAFSRGGPEALDTEPMISAGSVGVATITNVNAPVPAGPKPPAASTERKGDIEIKLTDKTVTSYQNALCVTPTNGKLGLNTRAAVSEYLTLRGEKDTSAQFDRRTPGLLQDAVDKVRSCRGTFLMNVYEVVNYGMLANRVQSIKSLQDELNKALKAKGSTTTIPITGQFTDDSQGKDPTRNAIAEARKLMTPSDAALQNMRDPKNRQIDANFDAAIAP